MKEANDEMKDVEKGIIDARSRMIKKSEEESAQLMHVIESAEKEKEEADDEWERLKGIREEGRARLKRGRDRADYHRT